MSAIDELSRKFVSGNDVQVERASFTREEWQSVVDERDQLRDALSIAEGLAKQNKEMAEGFIQLRDRVAELEASTAKIKAEAVRWMYEDGSVGDIDCGHTCIPLYTATQAQPSGNPVGVVREFHVDWHVNTPPEGTELYSYGSLGPSLLEQSDLEFIAARLGRVAKRVGYPMPSGDAQFIVSVSGSILGAIARILDGDAREKQAQPAPIPTAWQPIETAPSDVHVLVHYAKHITDLDHGWQWDSDAHRTFVAMRSGGYWIQDLGIGESLIVEPTHWQPLPPAPGGEG